MLLSAALRGSLMEAMAGEAAAVRRASLRAGTESTNLAKTRARAHVASRLGRRAGYLITSKIYDDGGADVAGFLWSRWKRRRAGVGGKHSDILAAHAYGAVIEPRQSKYLYIPLARGRLRRRERRLFSRRLGLVDIIPYAPGRLLVVQRRRRGKGKPIAILVDKMRLKPRLRLGPIYRDAERDLRSRLVRYLNEGQPAAA